MPMEDKTEVQEPFSASPSAAGADFHPDKDTNAIVATPASALPHQEPTESRPAKLVVQVRYDADAVVPVNSGDKTGQRIAADDVAAKSAPTERGIAAHASEGGTVPQDDQAMREALSLSQTLLPEVPGYEILKKLGQGTYGVVWHAREVRTHIEVAIKFFAHGAGEQWQTLQAEVKQLAMLHADPGIVQLIDVEPNAVPPYFIMNYAEQGSLAKRLEAGPLPLEEAVEIFRRIVEALAYVHAKGIRHCDLKPGNILLDARGRPNVADFGQAHLSNDASPALGTFFYMAPEQADLNRQIPDTRWDVYGLGALLYAMVTGRPPRQDSTLCSQLAGTEKLAHRLERYRLAVASAASVTKHRNVPGMDRPLADIISRCLEVEPDKRFHDANAILEALKRRDWRRQQRPLLIFGLLAPLLLLVSLGVLGWYRAEAAVAEFRTKHENQVLADCKSASGLIRSVIKSKLVEQIERVKSTAKGEYLAAALADKPKLLREAHLARNKSFGKQDVPTPGLDNLRKKLSYLGKYFKSWHLTDNEGTSLAGDVYVTQKPGESDEQYLSRCEQERAKQGIRYTEDFSWRKWFNGIQDFPEKDRTDDPNGANADVPRDRCWWLDHAFPAVIMTDPFVNKRDKKRLIGLSAPVFVHRPGQVTSFMGLCASGAASPLLLGASSLWANRPAGVILATIEMEEFHGWLKEATFAKGHAVVIDSKGMLLFHTEEFNLAGAAPQPQEIHTTPLSNDLDQVFQAARRRASDDDGNEPDLRNANHYDRVLGDHEPYLAGYAPIINRGEKQFEWVAIVQQNRAKVMQPVEDIRRQMLWWGGIKLATAGVLLLGMWAWLLRKLLREEKTAHA
jgi:serine/threonine protein kinase